MLVREPKGVVENVRVFRDEWGTGRRSSRDPMQVVGGTSGEAAACAFYLEHRHGPRSRSASDADPERLIGGRTLHGIDFEETVQRIELAIKAALPREWRAAVVVSLGWRVGVTGLRSGVWLRRAGFSERLPPGLSRHTLASRCRDLREVMIARGLIAKEGTMEMERVEREEEAARVVVRDEELVGWGPIAQALGVSERTAQRYEKELGLPVGRLAPGAQPRVSRSEIEAWKAARVATCRDMA